MALLVSERVGQFFVDEHRLEYTEYGSGGRWVVLVPGQLVPRSLHQRLARVLAADGAHVVALDLLGHGRSDRPVDPRRYSMAEFADQVLALLDHLGAEQAVVGGTSMGANVALEVAAVAPQRVRALLLEMPILDNSLAASVLVYAPLMLAARTAPFAVDAVRVATRLVPRGVVPLWAGVVLDTLNQRPRSMAAALHGVFFGRIAPPSRVRAAIDVPALVVGHRRDPLHSVHDARMAAEELPRAEYVEASGPLEWRLAPQRLDAAAAKVVNIAWATRPARRRRSLAR
ncbi:MAG TPA: alpha/beta hydrolase [Nocardioidaceae bacterium]|nr:alpha/beta hydrolase [Nocardioidaceae bacterium]